MRVSLVERCLAVVILILLSPLFAVIGFFVAVTMGRPVFYVGERLGYHKKPFNILKFRTLGLGAQQRIGGQLYDHTYEKIRQSAQFMRDSRLDELPQLLNIARGEMQFIGPRPERYEVYLQHCKDLPNYEDRFLTAPGVIGFSQLCTPHSAPKSMRARIDRRYVKNTSHNSIAFGLFAIWALFRRLVLSFVNFIWRDKITAQLLKGRSERRSNSRANLQHSQLEIYSKDGSQRLFSGNVCDINQDHLRIAGDFELDKNTTYLARMTSCSLRSFGKRTKVAYCYINLVNRKDSDDSDDSGVHEYLVEYSAKSPLNRYLIDQYFLHRSIISRPI